MSGMFWKAGMNVSLVFTVNLAAAVYHITEEAF